MKTQPTFAWVFDPPPPTVSAADLVLVGLAVVIIMVVALYPAWVSWRHG